MSEMEVKEVIAKFRLTGAKTNSNDDPAHPIIYDLMLVPVVDGSAENKEFFKYTPWGQINLGTINEKAAKLFLDGMGKEFYVTFRRVPEPQT